MARTLTMAEVESIKAMGGHAVSASRFMANGGSFDILNGESTKRGTNIINQFVYWDLTREQAQRAAELTGTRLEYDAESDAEIAEREATRARQTQEHMDTIAATGAPCHCPLHR